MPLKKMFTAFVLVLGMSLLFLGRGAGPGDTRAYDGQMRIVTRPEQAELPSTETVATPKGDRKVRPPEISHYDIPLTALLAYQRAADIIATVKPSCDLSWTLLAGIGRVESNHGRYADATLGADGVSSPQVIGVALDGAGPVAKIRDTDDGRWDQDRTWDRAVGPMQFLPETWQMVAVDGDGDGTRSIDDIDDAALAAGVYLCAGPEENLGSSASMESALLRYNNSEVYVALVMAYERKYRGGDFEVVTKDGAVTEASAALSGHPLTGTPIKAGSRAEARAQARIKADVRKAAAEAEKTGGTTPGISGKLSAATRTAGSRPGGGNVVAGGPDDGRSPADPSSGTGSASGGSSDAGAPASGSETPASPPPPGPTGSDTATPGETESPSPSDSGSTGSGSTGSGSTDSGSPATDSGSGSGSSSPSGEATCTPTPEPSPSPSPDETATPAECDAASTEPNPDPATCETPCPSPTASP